MSTARNSPALLAAAALDVVAAAALFLPWWRAVREPVLLVAGPTRALDSDTWAGWEIVGGLRAALLIALVMAGAVAAVTARVRSGGFAADRVRPSRWRVVLRVLIVAAGAATAVVGVTVLARWGISGAPGAWVATLAGIGAAALAVSTVSHRGASVALVVAIVVVALPGPPPRPDRPRSDGPFVRLAGLNAPEFRSGTPELAASSVGPRLVLVDGAPAIAGTDGLARVGPNGRAEVLARIPGRDGGVPLGVAGDRVARSADATTIAVTGLRAGDQLAVIVRNVEMVSPVGTDGSLWLTAIGDPAGTIRRLDLDAYDGAQNLDATFLPVVTIGVPDGAEAVDPQAVVPVPGGAVRTTGHRVERMTPTPSGIAVTVLAGGRDPACGLTRTGRDAYLSSTGPLAVDAGGGIWLAVAPNPDTAARLVHVDAAGGLRAVPHPLPGRVDALLAAPDGSITMIIRGPDRSALWRLPDASAALTDLPPTPPGCIPAPPPVGPAVGLLPIANISGEAGGVLLGVDGRFARGRGGSDITAVTPDLREIPLGVRGDGDPGTVRPDGAGGVWWLESSGDPGRVTLVHGRPGVAEERLPSVERPAPSEGSMLITDLGGRPPLLGTAFGAFQISGGVVRVVEGPIAGGVVRADGRGWLLADGRLLSIDGPQVLGPVIDAGERRHDLDTPVDVQLAKGIAPSQLSLPRASVGLDAGGRAVVVSDGVVLSVDDAGVVRVIAQDPRLDAVVAVEGGLATSAGPTRLRVDLPG